MLRRLKLTAIPFWCFAFLHSRQQSSHYKLELSQFRAEELAPFTPPVGRLVAKGSKTWTNIIRDNKTLTQEEIHLQHIQVSMLMHRDKTTEVMSSPSWQRPRRERGWTGRWSWESWQMTSRLKCCHSPGTGNWNVMCWMKLLTRWRLILAYKLCFRNENHQCRRFIGES